VTPELVRKLGERADQLVVTFDDLCDVSVIDVAQQIRLGGTGDVHGPLTLGYVVHGRFVALPIRPLPVAAGFDLDHAVEFAVVTPGKPVDVDSMMFRVGQRVGALTSRHYK